MSSKSWRRGWWRGGGVYRASRWIYSKVHSSKTTKSELKSGSSLLSIHHSRQRGTKKGVHGSVVLKPKFLNNFPPWEERSPDLSLAHLSIMPTQTFNFLRFGMLYVYIKFHRYNANFIKIIRLSPETERTNDKLLLLDYVKALWRAHLQTTHNRFR